MPGNRFLNFRFVGTFKVRIFQHADNFIIARSFFIAKTKSAPDGILIRKKVAYESFVHHRHFRGAGGVLQSDFSAEQQLDSKSVRIIRPDKNCLSAGIFIFFSFVTLHRESAGAVAASQRAVRSKRRRLHSGQRVQPIVKFPIERGNFRGFISGEPRIDARQHNIFLIKSERLIFQIQQASREECGAN